jgi:hypothetical protein
MPFPILIPVAAAIASGAVSAGVAGWVAGQSKKEASITDSHNQQNNIHQPGENYQPITVYNPVSSYSYQGAQYMINSPNGVQTPKQATALTNTPTVSPTLTNTQPYTPTSNTNPNSGNGLQGVDFTMIAIIGAVAVIGYALLKK